MTSLNNGQVLELECEMIFSSRGTWRNTETGPCGDEGFIKQAQFTALSTWTVTYMLLDIPPDLLAEGEVLSHEIADDLIEGLHILGHSCKAEKNVLKHE